MAAARRIDFPSTLDSMFVVPDIQGQASTQAAKRRHALVAQWIERPPPERKATSPILVEGTHENSVNHNERILSSLLSHAVAPRTVRALRGNALVAQRIERRFPKPGAAGPTPAGGTASSITRRSNAGRIQRDRACRRPDATWMTQAARTERGAAGSAPGPGRWKRVRPPPFRRGAPAGSLVFPLAAGTPHSRSPTTENKFPQSQHNLFSDVFSSHTTRPTTGHAPLAQRSEQRSFKPWVVGSNPTGGTSAVRWIRG